MFNVIKLVFS